MALGALACGPAGPSSSAQPQARLATATPAPASARKAILHYEINGRPFPLPIVSGTVAGVPVLMLVDTGANSHVIAAWFARKHKLPMKKLGDIGTDHVGKSISTYRIDRPALAIDGWGDLHLTMALATEVPDVIERLGIGVFISPQRLAQESDAVILDLGKGEIRGAWWDEAREELGATGSPLIVDRATACEENDGPVKGLAFVVPATIESQRVKLLLDTGAQHSDVFTSTPAGQKLAPLSVGNKEAMYTASGKISARRLKGAHVTAGSFTVSTDIDLIQGAADGACPRDGVLAMDVLRSCALLFSGSRTYGRCLSSDAKPGAR